MLQPPLGLFGLILGADSIPLMSSQPQHRRQVFVAAVVDRFVYFSRSHDCVRTFRTCGYSLAAARRRIYILYIIFSPLTSSTVKAFGECGRSADVAANQQVGKGMAAQAADCRLLPAACRLVGGASPSSMQRRYIFSPRPAIWCDVCGTISTGRRQATGDPRPQLTALGEIADPIIAVVMIKAWVVGLVGEPIAIAMETMETGETAPMRERWQRKSLAESCHKTFPTCSAQHSTAQHPVQCVAKP